jgi:peptidoglycan/xylan/chitin deacetylase (PgdA/CDA1 family)
VINVPADIGIEKESIKISVIVPAFNEEKLLPFCLDSLRNQTFGQPYEIIVADNNSTDRTSDVVLKMGAKVVFEPHQGITWARQKGLEAAQGEIIACVDADSRVEPDWLERIWWTLSQDSRVIAVSGGVLYPKGKTWRGSLHRWSTAATLFGDKALRFICRKPGTLWGANFAVKKSALIMAGSFNKKIAFYGEDTELSLRLRKLGKIVFDKKNVVQTSPRRFENGNVLKTTWQIMSNFIRLVVTDGQMSGEKRPSHVPFRKYALRVFCAASLLVALTGLIFFAFDPSSQLYGRVYSKGLDPHKKVIALSFDDGPNEPYTSEILRILAENEIKATFFVTGKNAEVYPDSVREIARGGHVIGNHTYCHSYRLPFDGDRRVRKDIGQAEDIIFGLTGLRTCLFRPPHGLRTPWFIKDLKALNYKLVTWSDMTDDYDSKMSPEEIARRIICHARAGGIIDLHDGKELFHGINRSNTVEALPVIISRLKNEGYRFVTLPELLHVAPYK